MKKFIFTAALAFASVSLFAQAAKTKPTTAAEQSAAAARQGVMAERQAKTYQQQYQLSNTQYKGVYDACLEFAKKVDAPRAEGRQITPQEFEAALNAKNEKFKAAMTPEQYKAYDATLSHTATQPVPAKAGTIRK